jgi:hypothetical protein
VGGIQKLGQGAGLVAGVDENNLLGFELVGQDEVCVSEDALVGWHDVFVHVELALVAHDGIEHCVGVVAQKKVQFYRP